MSSNMVRRGRPPKLSFHKEKIVTTKSGGGGALTNGHRRIVEDLSNGYHVNGTSTSSSIVQERKKIAVTPSKPIPSGSHGSPIDVPSRSPSPRASSLRQRPGSISNGPSTPPRSGDFFKGCGSNAAEPINSPPTPHKIQSLDELSLHLDENDLTITPSRNGISQHVFSPCQSKPLINTQNKTLKFIEEDDNKKKLAIDASLCPAARRRIKLTDYYPQRRSQRKTQEAINAEKHKLLINAIEEGVQHGLTAKNIPGKGRGVIAKKRFTRNEYVVEYSGELLTSAEAKAREASYCKDAGAGCYMYYFQHNNQQYCIDATKESDRLGRLINHSRNGNLVTKTVIVNGSPRLIFIAKKDIEVDEELSYDYGDRSRDALRFHPWLAT